MKKIIDIKSAFSAENVAAVARILRANGLAVLPTDTLYAVAADSFSQTAVDRIYKVKNRERTAPLPLMAASLAQVEQFLVVSDAAKKLAEQFWPGPLTMVLQTKGKLPGHITAQDGTVAIRTPNHAFCRAVAESLGRPITATSVNFSGEKPASIISEISPQFLEEIDLIVDQGESKSAAPSTIIRLIDGKTEILRDGCLNREEILRSLESEKGRNE